MAIKIAYLIQGTFNSGGMERVITLKANYLQEQGYQVTLITTDQKGRESFYPLHSDVRQIDLGLNYLDDAHKSGVGQYLRFLARQRKYRQRISKILTHEQFDIVISTFGTERYIIPQLKDSSIKIAESHFARSFRTFRQRGGVLGWLDRRRNNRDERVAAKYAKFVVLTKQDRAVWKSLNSVVAIPNPVSFLSSSLAKLEKKRAIAVGRLTYQKGFDMLLKAWAKVAESCKEWHLDIFGSGEEYNSLCNQIEELGIGQRVTINKPTSQIDSELLNSSIYLLSSRREGLPMVLLEAMGCGVPAVSFECESGPRDVITDKMDGVLVEVDNVDKFAKEVIHLIKDSDLRVEMGRNARAKIEDNFTLLPIMQSWETLFREVLGESTK